MCAWYKHILKANTDHELVSQNKNSRLFAVVQTASTQICSYDDTRSVLESTITISLHQSGSTQANDGVGYNGHRQPL